MNTQNKIKVMQAWVDGKIIQTKNIYDKHDVWKDIHLDPSWDWVTHIYRIKPETAAYRRYIWFAQHGHAVSTINKTKHACIEQVEQAKNFVRWLDHDWVYIEV